MRRGGARTATLDPEDALVAYPFPCLCTPFVSRCGTGMAGLPHAPSFHALAKGADGTDGSRAVSLDI